MGSKRAQILMLQKQAESRLLLNCSGADTLTYLDRARGIFGDNKSEFHCDFFILPLFYSTYNKCMY